jgi:hypothetical protein
MDVDEPAVQEKKPQQQQRRRFRKGGWVAVEEGEGEVRGKRREGWDMHGVMGGWGVL